MLTNFKQRFNHIQTFILDKKQRFIVSLVLSIVIHSFIIFPYLPSKKIKNKAQILTLTEVSLYKKPPPKKKIIKKIIKKKNPKPKPKKVEKPPKKIIEQDIDPTPILDNLKNPKPVYPKIAIQRGWQGTCILELEVLNDGTVGSIKLLKTSGRKLLDQSAIKAVRYWNFTPATKKGKNIKSKLKVPIEFKLEG